MGRMPFFIVTALVLPPVILSFTAKKMAVSNDHFIRYNQVDAEPVMVGTRPANAMV
jgi:hypothetical protein